MLKVFSGKVFKTPRGSLRSLRVWSPVLVTVAVTFKFPNPSTLLLWVEATTVKPGPAETTAAEATRATREARMEEDSIVAKVLKVVDEAAPTRPGNNKPGLNSLRVPVPHGWSRAGQPGEQQLWDKFDLKKRRVAEGIPESQCSRSGDLGMKHRQGPHPDMEHG